jgi:hypothetical protein
LTGYEQNFSSSPTARILAQQVSQKIRFPFSVEQRHSLIPAISLLQGTQLVFFFNPKKKEV